MEKTNFGEILEKADRVTKRLDKTLNTQKKLFDTIVSTAKKEKNCLFLYLSGNSIFLSSS